MAADLVAAKPDDLPVVVNSAGCGSTMKEYGHLVGPAAEPYAKRVVDISEFLLANGLLDILATAPGLTTTATYHDACHLAHGQRIWTAPRTLLAAIPQITMVELPEADTCCGSAGIYNVVQPEMARKLLDRKWANVETTRAKMVATGNPGCHAWIAQAAREHGGHSRVLHTAELLEAAFVGLDYF
jgi:glycolate oxidase iron-sulfur subunit